MTTNRNAIEDIQSKLAYYNPALRKIADYILNHLDESQSMTIKKMASVCSVAESTVTRFVKESGYKNYQALKLALAQAVMEMNAPEESNLTEAPPSYVYEDIQKNESIKTIIDKIHFRNMQVMTTTKDHLNYTVLRQAVDLIEAADLILFIGTGSSAVACEEGVMRFTRAGKRCLFPKDNTMQLMMGCCATTNTLVLGITHSGKTRSIVQTLKYAKAQGAKTICITSDSNSPVISESDVSIFTADHSHPLTNAINWESTAAKTAQIMVIDILYGIYASYNFEKVLENLDKTYQSVKETR
ncbi:MurR/RpiR family transcriptional regulator [Eubacterium barkeri]|uniref:DNA-binding transcriptional regulator, MurR/RpiR family, contains HTH and SIS domains n=1 Tax=Eubacterium barkeri TaxID=1528 RepID=A0A1H3JKZ5_EUBBA|nr:MurR/RpiR family transcriptional regulator [Eubacterium barkeri]SDY40249.1 DNA-binding transcriptional regulator, MurR/RpiR family, contains HTH and SIS domains [Eubacterium barkeri]